MSQLLPYSSLKGTPYCAISAGGPKCQDDRPKNTKSLSTPNISKLWHKTCCHKPMHTYLGGITTIITAHFCPAANCRVFVLLIFKKW